MMTYDFDLLISGASYDDTLLEEKLFSAGCDDAMLVFQNSIAHLTFSREANTLVEAIVSAISDAEKSGIKVERILPDDLVNANEISRRVEKSRQYISNLISGKKGPGKFPTPATGLTEKAYLWSWYDVTQWLLEHKIIDDQEIASTARIIAIANQALHARNNQHLQQEQTQFLQLISAATAA